MLKLQWRKWYKVKEGQTVRSIAEAFCVSERLLVQENGLQAEPCVGQVLRIPEERGNAYTVKAGDTKALLCGSEESFRRKNGDGTFYIGMRAIL